MIGQNKISIFENYVIYQNDTLNRFDKYEKKSGVWITYRIDSISKSEKITDEDGIIIKLTNTKFNIYRATGRGIYLNDQRQGKWTYGSDDFKEIKSEVVYKNDTIQSPILFYSYNSLWLKAVKDDEKWVYYLWDKDKNTFINPSHQKFTLDFLFGVDGFNYTEIK